MERFKVFVSSTSLDLRAERKAVADVLRKSGLPVTTMEDWDALPAEPTTVSLDGVNNCDIFVGIYAFRYGFIPPGSTTSITEQEYEMARREGKRCLCYFKAEATAASAPADPSLLEPVTSRNLLTAFKQRVEKELVRAYFTSPDNLAAELAVDISRLERGYLPGYSPPDLLKRWANRGIETRSQLIQGALSGHTNLLPSPVLGVWSKLIKGKAWHEIVKSDLRSISELAKELPNLSPLRRRASDLASRLDGGDESASLPNYHTILTELDQTITDTNVSNVDELIQELRRQVQVAQKSSDNPYPLAEEKLMQARRLQRELRIMRESIKRPSFRKCFPVIGSLGSGRTHFIASLLGSTPYYWGKDPIETENVWCENDNFLVLLIDQSSTKSLEETILDGVIHACGLQWQTLDEFDRFISGKSLQNQDDRNPIRFVIAIDDLQRWLHNRNKFTDAVEELTQFIESHTYLSSVFWLFTLQDTSYSQVRGLNALLRNYSYFQTQIQPEIPREPRTQQTRESTASHFSGWLALDDLNRNMEFGLKLIEKGLKREGGSLPALGLLRENKAALRNVIKPFVASVLLDLHSEQKLDLNRLATLSYMSFVTEFWAKRKDEFIAEYNRLRSSDSQVVADDEWSQALKLLAETLCQTGEFNPLQRDLQASVVNAARRENHPAPEPMVAAALAALTKSGFLKAYLTPDPEMPEYEVQKIGFEFEPFWEQRLAEHIRAWNSFKNLNQTAARDDLINWFGVVEASDIEEGVLEFLLLLLDSDAGRNGQKRGFVGFLQRSAIDCEELPEEAVWFSGVNATFESQAMLMELVGQGRKQFNGHRLLHSIMYFLVEALPEISEPADRFKVLQPHYADINRRSLSAYFLYVARRLLTQATDNRAVRRSMRYLSGSEVMGIAEALASLTVNVLFRKAEEQFGELNDASLGSLISIIMRYLKDASEEAKNEYDARGRIDRWERCFYREWVLRFFCSRLVYERGVQAYDLLAGMQWYEPRRLNISWPVSVEMHREANFALGDWYRLKRWGQRAEQYLTLVRRLVYDGDLTDRETAFYLIRHSEPTHGQRALLVDEVFVPMLEEIFLDPKLDRTVSRFYDLFRINLYDFRKLEGLRKRKLAQRNDSARQPTGRRKARRNKRVRD
jgi:uncharacterized protein DUF4062